MIRIKTLSLIWIGILVMFLKPRILSEVIKSRAQQVSMAFASTLQRPDGAKRPILERMAWMRTITSYQTLQANTNIIKSRVSRDLEDRYLCMIRCYAIITVLNGQFLIQMKAQEDTNVLMDLNIVGIARKILRLSNLLPHRKLLRSKLDAF